MILGAQLAPALGFLEGKRGDHFRAAGWRASRCSASAAYDFHRGVCAIDTVAHKLGFARLFRRISVEVNLLYRRLHLRKKLLVLATVVREVSSALWRRLSALWVASGNMDRLRHMWLRWQPKAA